MNEQHTLIHPSVRAWALSCVMGAAGLGCGGSEPAPPPAPTTTPPPPTATAVAQPEPAPEAPRIRVDLLEAKMSPPLDKPITVRVTAPGPDQYVPAHYAQSYKIRFSVTGAKLPEGAFLQLVLDNVPFRPVSDLKETLTLSDLAGEGKDLAEGEHLLAAYLALPSQEAVRSPSGVSVSRFWIGKREGDSFKSTDPLLVLGSPSGSYRGDKAQEIIADYYVVNAPMSDKEYSVRMVLKGPGAEGDGLQRLLTEWKPALVLGPQGDYSLEATLLDPEGKPVTSPWNPVVRKFSATPKDE